ncbi:MAG: beta-hexosaminidase [Roseinatronobacter sp.]|nr:beta-hexosaminidase [Roseinatronobacter sp.]
MSGQAPRAVIFGCAGLRLTPAERAFFREADPWGAVLFARNVETPSQLLALTEDLRSATGRDLPILIDQEGGRVQRLRPPHWRGWPPALDQCLAARDPVRAMYLRGRLIAAELLACGISVNCAPLADIATEHTHAVLRNRCYGTDRDSVITHARAMAEGLMAGGVLPVLKHIPGHGRASLDSHLALPVIDTPAEELRLSDFAAFRALADLPLGMTAHLVFSQIDPDAPATQSAKMIALIGHEIGFDVLLMTDDISMQALDGPIGSRATAAMAAGCDMILHCNGDLSEMGVLAACCPRLEGAAYLRATRALDARLAPLHDDIDALAAEYADLTSGIIRE